jgi:hypothetical protein
MGACTSSIRTTTAFVAWFCLELACGGTTVQPPPDLGDAFFGASWKDDTTEVRNCRNSIDHDLKFIRVLASGDAVQPYLDRAAPFPEGSVVLKAEYEDEGCTQLVGFTAMRKGKAGSRPTSGDWSFQRTDAARKVISLNQGRCISCHRDCQGTEGGGYDWTCADP